ncbi:putative IQ motif and ankyrin repeat domain-containing protein [Fasciola gigantica]|uniref:Putative IQ motif and ankyrin repeat domain-containing protein n=1 Tax=Fasciola gigantica TaxID=46835 RepID=A0A504YH98_FASGI|nr:putative IQ motif and ankyrin repeat domain-containing protein [Fasciola gigantica]
MEKNNASKFLEADFPATHSKGLANHHSFSDDSRSDCVPSCTKTKAAITIQKYVRRFIAKKERQRRMEEKLEYEARIEKLSQNAYLQMVDRYRKEQERKREKELERERHQKMENMRKKRMLEFAYEGKHNEMRLLLKEVIDEDDANGVGHDEIGEATRLRHRMQLIECQDPNNNSALSEACIGGSVQAVTFLVDEGADVNSKGQFGRTPLYRAAFGGHVEVVQVLLQHGADPRLCTDDGQRPIDVATEGTMHELFDTWDIQETERLLRQISIYKEYQNERYNKGAQAFIDSLKEKMEDLQRSYQAAQKEVCKAHEELRKRVEEYDSAEQQGYENMALLEKVIHDAEFHLESEKLAMERALERLQEAKLELREEERKDKRNSVGDSRPGIVCSLRDLDDVLFKDVGCRLSWPLVVDPTDQASTFLRYRDTNYLNVLNAKHMDSETIRVALLGALRYGKPVVLDLMELDNTLDTICRRSFESIKKALLEDIIQKHITNPFVYEYLIKPTDSDEFAITKFIPRNLDRFMFIIVTKNPFPQNELLEIFTPVWVD